jgi:hypothetical protein
MKKCLIKPCLIVFAMAFTFFFILSCSKDEVNIINNADEESIMISFKSVKEFKEALTKVNSLSSRERKLYEETKGYKSFGRICDEIYSNLDPEDFKSVEEIETYISANGEYFQLLEDNNGELTVEKALYNNPFRYFLNKERMFKIERTVYRIFNDVTVATNEQNTDKLRNLDKSSLSLYNNDKDLTFIYSKSDDVSSSHLIAKDYPPYPYAFCGSVFYGEAVDGRDQTRLRLELKRVDPPFNLIYTSLTITPYKKTLGHWWVVSRTISWDVKYATDLYINETWTRVIHYPPAISGADSPNAFNVFETDSDSNATDFHFGGFSGWGRTPSAPVIYLSCNPNIF